MSKLTYEDKINLYNDKKKGMLDNWIKRLEEENLYLKVELEY